MDVDITSALRSDFFPGSVSDGVATFVEFDAIDDGFDRFAGQIAFLNALRQDGRVAAKQWIAATYRKLGTRIAFDETILDDYL